MPLLRIGARIVTGRVSPTSFIGPLVSLAGIVALVFLLVTGRIDLSKFDTGSVGLPESTATQPGSVTSAPVVVQSPVQPVVVSKSKCIRLLSLNWQAVRALTGHPQWLARMATMLADVDIVAFQQIEPADYSAFQSLMNQLNQQGIRFGLKASEEAGRGAVRERLAFLWNQERVMLVPESAYSILDDADRLLIEPYIASFEVRTGSSVGHGPFHFCLMNVHCRDNQDSRQTQMEMDVLSEVYPRVYQFEANRQQEDDVIFLGDFTNSGVPWMPLLKNSQLVPILTNQTPANRVDRTGQILLNPAATREFTGRCGSFRLDEQLGLPNSGATAGTLPIWAEFSTEELRPES